MKRLTLDENMPNIDRVFKRLHDTKIDGVHTELTMVEADAVEDSVKSDKEFEDAMKEIRHDDTTLSEKDDEKAVGRNRWHDQKHPHRLVNNIYTNPTNESKIVTHKRKVVESVDDPKYTVTSYYDYATRGVESSESFDSLDEVKDFVWEKVQEHIVKACNNITGKCVKLADVPFEDIDDPFEWLNDELNVLDEGCTSKKKKAKKIATEAIDIDSLDDSGNKDWQIDYDMYQFITDILEPDFVKPQHPRNLEIGKGYYKFGTISKPERLDDTPVIPAPNPYRGDILVMSNDEKELEHVANVLNKYYKIKSSDIMSAEDVVPNRHRNFSKCIIVTVPKWSPDYPFMFVDYMEDIGLNIDDVMETTSKAGKSDAFRRAVDRQTRKDKFNTKKIKGDTKDENLCVRKHK